MENRHKVKTEADVAQSRSNLSDILKILLLCLCFIFIIAYVAITGISSLDSVKTSFNSFYQEQFIPVVKTNKAMRHVLQIRINMIEGQNAALRGDMREVRKRRADSGECARQYQRAVEGIRTQVKDPESMQFLRNWDARASELAGLRNSFFVSLEHGNSLKGRALYNQWLTGYRSLRDDTYSFITRQENIGNSALISIKSNAQDMIKKSFFILGISIVLGFMTTWILARLFLKGSKKDFSSIA